MKDEEIRTGLEYSDTEYASGIASAGYEDLGEADQRAGRRAGRALRLSFCAGILTAAVLLLITMYVFNAARIVTGSQYRHYTELEDKYGKYDKIVEMIGDDPIAVSTPDGISEETLRKLIEDSGDPYAQYFTKEEYEEFWKRYDEDYVGVGISVTEEDKGIVIKRVLEDSPAEESGLREEDIIVKVDGKAPADINDAISMIGGKAGTKVTLTILRDGSEMDVDVNRAVIDQESVGYVQIKDHPGIGYIQIAAFRNGTADEFKAAVKDLKKKDCDKFIIDLRSNGGGLTDESVKIADYLLPECRIMTEVKKDGTEKVFNSKAGSAEIECIVLTDENTASASEILAGALQDNKGAVIIGSTTYGKGVTQITHKFRDGSAVKITESEYLRPSGAKVNGVGISPDIETEPADALEAAVRELEK